MDDCWVSFWKVCNNIFYIFNIDIKKKVYCEKEVKIGWMVKVYYLIGLLSFLLLERLMGFICWF